MTKRILFTLFSFHLAIQVFATTPVRLLPQENWQMSEDKQFAYATHVDAEKITLQLEILSPHLMMQSQTSGLKAYIDLTGKKKEKYSVAFPVLQGFVQNFLKDKMPQNMNPPQGERKDPPTEEQRPPMEFSMKPIPETVTPLKPGDSFASFFVDNDERLLSAEDVTVSYVDGRMFYTCTLPLSMFGTKRNKNGVYNIAVAPKEMDFTKMKAPTGSAPSGFPQGGMGGPGGGMGGPGGGMGRPGGGMGRPGGGMGGPGGGMGGP
ncbi:MAG: hypothetical protein HUK08_09535, partial [Bacteroidaceae bacterium]|nr:hypothetical protein [Bacteroidaceae bacterium]